MRLLDAESLEIVEVDEVTPPYAILSHRWEDEEISLADLNTPVQDAVLGRRGYRKVRSACEYTRQRHGLRYIWIDTCCIDKSSSAELSEAINSMYRWYEESVVCFAFLSDVSTIDDIAEEESEMSKSKWFTRGWTLQELLAPKKVIFLSSSWAELGTRAEISRRLSKITSIGESYLSGEEGLGNASIACRMSWASQRVTKRPEDRAYCLLGIFDVNMPLLYGEGLVKAFRRLQEEILKDTTDQSIFAWWQKGKRDAGSFGFLARTPADFAHSGDVISWRHPELPSFELTRRAIGLTAVDINSQTYVTLQCKYGSDPTKVLAIGCVAAGERNHLYRVSAGNPDVMYSDRIWQTRPIFAMKHQPQGLSEQSFEFDVMIEQTSELVKLGRPAGFNFTWDPKSRTLRRAASNLPFKVQIPVHVGNIETDIGLWLVADVKGPQQLFVLDLVALVPPWESFVFKPGAYTSPTGRLWQSSELSHSSRQVKSIDFEGGRREIPFMTKLDQGVPCYILSIVVQWIRSNDGGSQYILSTRLEQSAIAKLAAAEAWSKDSSARRNIGGARARVCEVMGHSWYCPNAATDADTYEQSKVISTQTTEKSDERLTARFPDVLFTPLARPEAHPAYIYNGFCPSKTVLPAGHQRSGGRRSFAVETIFERDVQILMRDGAKLYTDIFRPSSGDDGVKVPVVIAWGPYGKSGGIFDYDRMGPFRCGIPLEATSGYEKFEAPDPADWVARGYAILNVDARGAGNSDGDIFMWGEAEAMDVYDTIDWASKQPWCSGAVAMAGNSWLAISQINIASRFNHPALKAIAPWEALNDTYRDFAARGGIIGAGCFGDGFPNFLAGNGAMEDSTNMPPKRPLFDDYWADKACDVEKITIPMYLTASFSTGLHSRGSFETFIKAKSADKWLRVHPYQECKYSRLYLCDLYHVRQTNSKLGSDLYRPEINDELQAFFDHYVKGEANGWEATPRVRLSLLGFNDSEVATIVERPENSWPLPEAEQRTYFLDAARRTMSLSAPSGDAATSYQSHHLTDCAGFTVHFDAYTELAGYPVARLFMSYEEGPEMDVQVQIRKVSKEGKLLVHSNYQCPIPEAELPNTNIVKFLGPDGKLRASHHVSKVMQGNIPWYAHDKVQAVRHGEIVQLDIPLWPIGMVFAAGEGITLRVAGHDLRLPEMEMLTLKEPADANQGLHRIHTGQSHASYLLLPVISR